MKFSQSRMCTAHCLSNHNRMGVFMLSNCLISIGYIYERNLIEKCPGVNLLVFHFFSKYNTFLLNVKSRTIPIRIMSAIHHTYFYLTIIIFLPVPCQRSLNTSVDGRMLASDFDMWWSVQKCRKRISLSPLI